MEYAYANDTSKWQFYSPYKIPPKLELAEERGIKLIVPKKTQGIYQDPAFGLIWNALKARPNIKRSIYHWFDPYFRSNLQIDAALAGLVPEDITAPMWLDVEQAHYISKSVALQRMLDILYAFKEFSGRPVAIYTNKYKFDTFYSNKPGWEKDWLLVVANYGVANPVLPTGWTDWDGWQITDKNGLGKFFGYQSANVDIDIVRPVLLGE